MFYLPGIYDLRFFVDRLSHSWQSGFLMHARLWLRQRDTNQRIHFPLQYLPFPQCWQNQVNF